MTSATDADHVRVTRRGGVSEIRLDRPEKKNALTGAMYAALTAALAAGEADEAVAVHLLGGAPGVFTAGNDMEDFVAMAATGRLADDVAAFLATLARLDKPLVCAVDGAAIGIGTTLLFHADLVYASDRSLFRTPFVDLGLTPEAAASLLAPARMGRAAAFELLCLGAPFDAERARAVGLVNRVVVVQELEETALAAATALAGKPRAALAASRRLMLSGEGIGRDAVVARIALETEEFGRRLASPEATAAFAAFLSRRGLRDQPTKRK
jgi:enoyl-CoA hydratase/carnithine racemase